MRSWYTWHRRTGVLLALIITVISVTGIALMVLPGTEAGRAPVKNGFITALYSQAPTRGPLASETTRGQIIQIDNTVYVEDGELSFTESLIGAVSASDTFVLASRSSLTIINDDGIELDKIDDLLLPGQIIAIGIDTQADTVLINTASGIFTGDESLSFWELTVTPAPQWAEIHTLKGDASRTALRRHRGEDISVYRVVLDLHTGRLFGFVGKALVWIATLVMLFLTGSGTWMWYGRYKRFKRLRS